MGVLTPSNVVSTLTSSSIASTATAAAAVGYSAYSWWKHRSKSKAPWDPKESLKRIAAVPANLFVTPSLTSVFFVLMTVLMNFVYHSVWKLDDPAKVCLAAKIPLKDVLKEPAPRLLHQFFLSPHAKSLAETCLLSSAIAYTTHFLQRCKGMPAAFAVATSGMVVCYLAGRLCEPHGCFYGPNNWLAYMVGALFALNHRIPLAASQWLPSFITTQRRAGETQETATEGSQSLETAELRAGDANAPASQHALDAETRAYQQRPESRWLPLLLLCAALPVQPAAWRSEFGCMLTGALVACTFMQPDGNLRLQFRRLIRNKRGRMLGVIGALLVTLGVFSLPFAANRPDFSVSHLFSLDWWQAMLKPSAPLSALVVGSGSTLARVLLKLVPFGALGGLAQAWLPVRVGVLTLLFLCVSVLAGPGSPGWRVGPGFAAIVAGSAFMLAVRSGPAANRATAADAEKASPVSRGLNAPHRVSTPRKAAPVAAVSSSSSTATGSPAGASARQRRPLAQQAAA